MPQETRETEVGNACRVAAIDQYVGLRIISLQRDTQRVQAYAFQVCMHGRPVVEVFQTASDVRQLEKQYQASIRTKPWAKMPTSFNRFVLGRAMMKSVIAPCSIHSETMIIVCGDFFAPTNGNRF